MRLESGWRARNYRLERQFHQCSQPREAARCRPSLPSPLPLRHQPTRACAFAGARDCSPFGVMPPSCRMEKQIAREHFTFARLEKRFPREHFAFARQQKRFPRCRSTQPPQPGGARSRKFSLYAAAGNSFHRSAITSRRFNAGMVPPAAPSQLAPSSGA